MFLKFYRDEASQGVINRPGYIKVTLESVLTPSVTIKFQKRITVTQINRIIYLDLSFENTKPVESSISSFDDDFSNQSLSSAHSATLSKTIRLKNQDSQPSQTNQACIEANSVNSNYKEFSICAGSRVLALFDKSKHIWREATLYEIKDSNDRRITNSIKFSTSNTIKSSYFYHVKFDIKEAEAEANNDTEPRNSLLSDDSTKENLDENIVCLDTSSSSSQSSIENGRQNICSNKKRKSKSKRKNSTMKSRSSFI